MVKPTILIVEDNATQQYVMRELCHQFEYEVHLVSTGEEALEAVSCFAYAVVILDIKLPEMDGFDCAAKIRQLELDLGRRTPIVAVTAHAFDDDRSKCMEEGMDDYLAKPFSAEAFRTILLRWAYIPQRPNLKLLEEITDEEIADEQVDSATESVG